MFWVDASYLLVIPAMLFALWASYRVKSTFAKYNTVYSQRGMTAAMVARRILDENGLREVRIEQVAGNLTDHYDPKGNVIRLSESVYGSASVAAIGVAAHECGHAVQYAKEYLPIRIRAAMIPVTNIGSNIAIPLALFGVVLGMEMLINLGILLFLAVVFFQLVTLPVEFNASARAMRTLEGEQMLVSDELAGAKKVLTAAALTYVAALVVALANLARLLALRDRRRR